MSEFIVSARKYRPSTFKSVVGQSVLTTTLKNAILQEKLSHAYLFCGPRGVGKTSCARIFAKTINCMNRTEDGEACNACESCVAINEQRSYNVMELDAASNNSVNDIRTLTDQVYIAPSRGKYRVYIIDEVHMLSTSAFNAFLKTLEEPPAHAIFILATTEKHKVLPTIISRCQVHDFNRITADDIAQHLQYIANEEGIQAEPDALQMIGINADGGMRDALSMFDQIAGYGGGVITMAHVRENLNLLDEEVYFKLLGYVIQGKHQEVLLLVDDLLRRGYEGDVVMRGFSNFLRNVLLAQSPETVALVEAPASIRSRMIKAAEYTPTHFLWDFLKISSAFGTQYKGNQEKRLLLEIALLTMCEKSQKSTLVATEPPTPTTPPPANTPQSQPQQVREPAPPQYPSRPITPHTATPPQPPKPKSSNVQKAYGFSITSGRKTSDSQGHQVQESNLQQEPVERLETPFTQEALKEVWLQYRKDHVDNIFAAKTMLNHIPKLQEGAQPYDLTLQLQSQSEVEQMNAYLPQAIAFLREQLKNDLITVRVELQPLSASHHPTTPREKLQLLAEENIWIEKLVNTLQLYPTA